MESESIGLQDFFALLRRRRLSMFVSFSAVSIAVVFGTLLLDDQYRSTATIAIIKSEMPVDLGRPTINYFDTDLRIARMRDRVLTTSRIEDWIRAFDLYQDMVSEDSMNAAVSKFRNDVEVITIQAREDIAIRKQGETIAFDLSYYGETPTKAALIASELANQFLLENRASRNRSVEDTVEFFQRNVDRLALEISKAEANLAEFKETHPGAMLASANLTTQMLDRRERELDDVEREIRNLRETRQILETDLSRESPNAPIFTPTGEVILSGADRLNLLQQQFVELSSKYGPEHPDIIRMRKEIGLLTSGNIADDADSIRRELEIARRGYAVAQQRYTASHPDVRNLANKIQTLESRLANSTSRPQTYTETRPDNPAYIRILVQIKAIDVEISALRQSASSLRNRINEYETLLLAAPQVEREYVVLQREIDQATHDYNEARDKQTNAQQALDLETSEKGERYMLQHTPAEPMSPAFPNRRAIIILGIIFAVAFSFAAVLAAEALDTKVRSVRDLKSLTGMPPIAVIPILETQSMRKQRVYTWSFSVISVSSLLLYMIAIQI